MDRAETDALVFCWNTTSSGFDFGDSGSTDAGPVASRYIVAPRM